ncbi:MAG: pyridoxamine 5'-phosphate oxidase family protein [Dehalococcoidia bacterium]
MGDNELLVDLFESQRLAVLATQRGGQPHGCLVAFSYTTDLKNLMFATRRDTRKFQDISINPPVAMLVDNRSNGEEDFKKAVAVTARGNAFEADERERIELANRYLAKHPYLTQFLEDESVALVKVEVEEYLLARFDSTEIIKPD